MSEFTKSIIKFILGAFLQSISIYFAINTIATIFGGKLNKKTDENL